MTPADKPYLPAPEEIWKPIPGYPTYEVSNLGRVRRGERILVPRVGRKGYLRVCLYVPKCIRQQRAVHALVLTAFVGPKPPNMQACHYDGNPANNALSNLRWGTAAENYADKRRHGTHQVGERHGAHKLSDWDVSTLRKLYSMKDRGIWHPDDLAAAFGVDRVTIERAARGRSWKEHYAPPSRWPIDRKEPTT